MKKLNTFCKSTTTYDFQSVVLVLVVMKSLSMTSYLAASFYIVLLVLYWPVDLSLTVKSQVEKPSWQRNYLEGFMLIRLSQPIRLDLRQH